MGKRVECAQDVETLTPSWRAQKEARHGPEEAQEGSEHKVGCSNEKDGALPGTGLG
jgi:hypothetical protein